LKKFNPILLLVFFTVLIFILRKLFFPEFSDEALITSLEAMLGPLGVASIAILLGLYFFCSFFFIPILIPLNIACGALYGPLTGSLVALSGILVSCLASTVSVRYVFRGLGKYAMEHPDLKDYLVQVTRHGALTVILVRLAFVVPYLLQNLVLAMTNLSLLRLITLTFLGAIPGVVSYSFLGAGLMSLENTQSFVLYLSVPLFTLVGITLFIPVLRKRLGVSSKEE